MYTLYVQCTVCVSYINTETVFKEKHGVWDPMPS
jgi:hypothetical protein